VLLTRVALQDGCTGMGFSYLLSGNGVPMYAAAHSLSDRLQGATLFHPAATWRALNDTLNRSRRGPNYLALAALVREGLDQQVPPVPCESQCSRKSVASMPGSGPSTPVRSAMSLRTLSKGT
jgi:hypothetical protein